MEPSDVAGWSRAEKAGALLLAGLAIALGLIAADIMSGGRLFTRGCCAGDGTEAVSTVDSGN